MKYLYLPNDFQNWFARIVQSEKCYVDILYELKASRIALDDWLISGIDEKTKHEMLPIGRRLGWLKFPKDKRNQIILELKEFIKTKLIQKIFTYDGIINIINLISRIDLTHNEQYELMEIVLLNIDEKEYDEISFVLINCLNNQNWCPDYELHSHPKGVEEWEYLFREVQYLDSFNDPTEVLWDLANIMREESNILKIFSTLEPIPKARLLSFYGLRFAKYIKSQDLLTLLKNDEIEVDFFVALIFNIGQGSNISTTWLSNDIIEWILENKWDIAGRILVRRIFGVYHKTLNDELKVKMQDVINITLKKWFTETKLLPRLISIVKTMKWPTDFEALVSWLDFCRQREKPVDLNDKIIDELVIKWTKIIKEISENIPNFVSDRAKDNEYWVSNAFEQKSRLALTYTFWFLLNSSQKVWEEWQKVFKNILYKIKLLYYGSYNANFIAKKFTEHFLNFILSLANITNNVLINQKSDRIQDIMGLMKDVILYPFIRLAEREELTWNPDAYKPDPYHNQELYLINEYLKMIQNDEARRSICDEFFKSWQQFSTTVWPWMR